MFWFSGFSTNNVQQKGPILLAKRLVGAVAQLAGVLHCHRLQFTGWHSRSSLYCTSLWNGTPSG